MAAPSSPAVTFSAADAVLASVPRPSAPGPSPESGSPRRDRHRHSMPRTTSAACPSSPRRYQHSAGGTERCLAQGQPPEPHLRSIPRYSSAKHDSKHSGSSSHPALANKARHKILAYGCGSKRLPALWRGHGIAMARPRHCHDNAMAMAMPWPCHAMARFMDSEFHHHFCLCLSRMTGGEVPAGYACHPTQAG